MEFKNKKSVIYLKRTVVIVFLLCVCIGTISIRYKTQNKTLSDTTIENEDTNSNNANDIVTNNDNIEITDIAQYYQNSTLKVAEEINSLNDNYVSFVIVTDTHGVKNGNNSQNIIRYLLKNTKADKLFHLGDSVASNWEESDCHLYFDYFNNCKEQVFYALGNHETYGSTSDDINMIYENLLAEKDYLYGSPNRFYYYFDDADEQIRYLVINTSDNSEANTTDEQLEWITESVKLPSDDWKLIVFGHIDINPNDLITKDWKSPKSEEITNALSSTNGTLVGYFCGHEHFDSIQKVNDKFYEIVLLNDSCSKDTTFLEITNPDRILGTESEQAVSVVSINMKTGDVDIRRIGAGENLTYNYLDK